MNTALRQERVRTVYRMLLALANGQLYYRIAADGDDEAFNALAQLLNQLAEKMQQSNYKSPYSPADPVSPKENEPDAELVEKVKEYIITHLEEQLPTAEALSKMFGSNTFMLKKAFRKHLQTSIYQFCIDLRLQKAHFLIAHTDMPLKEVPYLCGFNDYSNFLKSFKKKFGYTPVSVTREGNL